MFLLLTFSTSSICAQTTTNDQPRLVPPYAELPPTFWEQHKIAVLVGGFLFLIAQSIFLWKLLMRLQPVVEPPQNIACAALTRLLDEPEDGRILSEVSQILRRYFGAAFQMPGVELTTAEFITALARNEKIGPVLGESLAVFLRECDVRKFSAAPATPPIDAVERALQLVQQAEARRAKINSGTA
jgi:hypothetical protein